MKLIQALNGHVEKIKPIWMMRQAGRYLPEYMALRKNFSDFMDFCLNQEMAVQATLQPIHRFDFDAAIVFSDILVIPHFLGQRVHFKKTVGPILENPSWKKILNASVCDEIEVVYQSIAEVRKNLDRQKALIGFVGCPWTIASYMISSGKTINFEELVEFVKTWPFFDMLISKLSDVIAEHAINQLRAGADVVQLFESWAVAVPKNFQKEWLFNPAEKIVQRIRGAIPGANIIYYGKGVGLEALKALNHLSVGFGVSQEASLSGFSDMTVCLQGNLDPEKLLDGNFEADVLAILEFAKDRPFIVNLGHGILPDTPISHVEKFVELVRSQR